MIRFRRGEKAKRRLERIKMPGEDKKEKEDEDKTMLDLSKLNKDYDWECYVDSGYC